MDLLDPKSEHFELHPLNSLTETSLLVHFVTKSRPFGRWGVLHPPGYGPGGYCRLALAIVAITLAYIWGALSKKSKGELVLGNQSSWVGDKPQGQTVSCYATAIENPGIQHMNPVYPPQ